MTLQSLLTAVRYAHNVVLDRPGGAMAFDLL